MKIKGTIFIITVNIIVFIATLGGLLFTDLLGNAWGYTLVNHQYWRLFTCMFVHFGFSHIICNTVSLLQFGTFVETLYGTKKFMFLYILCGIGSSFFSAFINMILQRGVISAGASGAICGMMGLLLADLKGNKKGKIINLIICIIPIAIIGFSSGVDNIAHFSGVFVGYILGRLFSPRIK